MIHGLKEACGNISWGVCLVGRILYTKSQDQDHESTPNRFHTESLLLRQNNLYQNDEDFFFFPNYVS